MNYFKSPSGNVFFFKGNVLESIQDAYMAARVDGERMGSDRQPSVFAPIRIAGIWERCPIVGHRSLEAIKTDLNLATEDEKIFQLTDELSALRSRYSAVA